MTIFILIYEFMLMGLFTFGGGLATLPFLYSIADRRPWFTREFVIDMIPIAESTPGPIGINMATFAGYTAAGIPGGIIASVAITVPSVIIVYFIARAMAGFSENRFVQSAFYGLRPCVAALIAYAGIDIFLIAVLNLSKFDSASLVSVFQVVRLESAVLFTAFLLALRFIKKVQPVYLFAAAAVAGVLLKL